MKTILHMVEIDAEPRVVYRNLTTESGLGGWWSSRVSAATAVGGRIRFTFIGDFHPVMEILALDGDHLVEWKCVDGHEPWQDNTFHFEIEESGGGSRLRFRQEYARELSDEDYGRYNYNWGYYLRSLKLLSETGEGTPFRPDGDAEGEAGGETASVTVVNEWRFSPGADMDEAMAAIREYMAYLRREESDLEQSLWLQDREAPDHHYHIATYATAEALQRQVESPGTSRFVERLYPLIDEESVSQPVGVVIANTGSGPGDV